MPRFIDQGKKVTHGQGEINEKYWFSHKGEIYPVEYEHGDQTLRIAREHKMILPDKAITDYGFKSKWELANGMFLKKGWLRVQVYDAKTIGLNAKPAALEKKSTETASLQVLPKPKEFFFQENWPYTLQYKVSEKEWKNLGWKGAVRKARKEAKLELRQLLK